MKVCAVVTLAILAAGTALAEQPSHRDLARAISARGGRVSATDIRGVRCHGFAEEPTEFRCSWRQRSADRRWRRRTGSLAIDGDHWVRID
jgi:hypothetical protein